MVNSLFHIDQNVFRKFTKLYKTRTFRRWSNRVLRCFDRDMKGFLNSDEFWAFFTSVRNYRTEVDKKKIVFFTDREYDDIEKTTDCLVYAVFRFSDLQMEVMESLVKKSYVMDATFQLCRQRFVSLCIGVVMETEKLTFCDPAKSRCSLL